jgi:hypothetical protein
MSNLRERSNVCFSVECSKVLTMGYACKKSGRGRRVERDCPNEVSIIHPLGRVTWLPLYIVRGEAMYKELGSPDRAVVSLREGKQAILVVVMVLCPHRGMGWYGAIVPVLVALLTRWWFASHPVRRGLAVASVIVSWSPGGVI